MRPIRSIAIALLVASVAVSGCAQRTPDQSASPTSASPAVTAPPATKAPADTGDGSTTAAPAQKAPATQRPSPQDPVCAGAQSWGTGAKQVSAYPITSEIYDVRAARHDACDRVVFDINGLDHVGYLVRYVPLVHADPSGQPVRVAGDAALQVTIQAPDFRESGHQPWRAPWQLGERLVGGWATLREVRFAGSFEHVTTFAVGVRSQRPFRVLVLPDTGSHVTRVAVDIAH
ncbi:MAG TPA: hypothetical protein VFA45_09635 [Actinomycetes bacterium]|jgi:hypothetical protein|nr:hypothetical protein [Actinomycetes bacterium]